jgi:hypothetical protein
LDNWPGKLALNEAGTDKTEAQKFEWPMIDWNADD